MPFGQRSFLTPMQWRYDDGGRSAAGFRGRTGDCVVRAIAIACHLSYKDVYRALQRNQKVLLAEDRSRNSSPRYGVSHKVYGPFLESPLVAVVNGVLRDTYDPFQGGIPQMLHGYWYKA